MSHHVRHCERSEAIKILSVSLSFAAKMDCFVASLLAMTGKPTARKSAGPPRCSRYHEHASRQRHLLKIAVGEARLLEVEVALDPPPDLVSDLALAQESMNEFSLGG